MSDRSNFRVIQGKSEAEINISKKIRKHRLHSMLRVLLIVVVIVALAALLINSYKNLFILHCQTMASQTGSPVTRSQRPTVSR